MKTKEPSVRRCLCHRLPIFAAWDGEKFTRSCIKTRKPLTVDQTYFGTAETVPSVQQPTVQRGAYVD